MPKESARTESNPLLDLSALPRFEEIDAEHVEPAIDQVLAESRAGIEALAARADGADWDSFAAPLVDIDERLSRVWAPASHLNGVKDSPALRDAYERCLPKLSDFHTETSQDERLFRGWSRLAEQADTLGLDAAQRRIVTNAVRDFRLAGVDLPAADKERFRATQQELSTLGNRFERNVLDSTQAWTLALADPVEVEGLPESAVTSAREEAVRRDQQGWVFTLHGPSFVPFMTYAARRDLRQRMYEAYVTRASDQGPHDGALDNSATMVRILQLRHEAATLLGFQHYADYALATRMAKSWEQVDSFLRDLAHRARAAAEAELEEVRRLARDSDGIDDLQAWDIAYYSEKLRQARFDYSQEDIRPWFPLPKALSGMFAIAERLFGVRIREAEGVQTWHPDVRYFEVLDAADGKDSAGALRGSFFVDACARAGKRSGAWMDDCIGRRRTAEGIQRPVAFLVCNFTPASAERPSLLTHDEVLTLFHEFGHGLHHLLTRVDHVPVSGINGVPWDAVELPSQFLEYWCWQREAVDMISGHWQSGDSLPSDLFERLRSAMTFQSGMQMLRQVEFALFDMRIHGGPPPADAAEIQAMLDEVRSEVAVVQVPEWNRFAHGFGHIFSGGYAAGYYSYKWAEVLAADAFSRFEEEGVFSPTAGRAFLETILEQGGVSDPMDLFRKFRGREPQIDALLRHAGLDREAA